MPDKSAFELEGTIGVDIRPFEQGIDRAEQRLRKTAQAFDRSGQSSDKFKGKLDGTGKQSTRTGQELEKTGKHTHQLSTEFDMAANKAGSFSGRLGSLSGAVSSFRNKFSAGGGGSFLPGLANISEIIQGIPQVGGLIHALVNPLTSAAEEGVKFNAFLETSKIAFEGVLGSGEKVEAFIGRLQTFAAKTPFQFEDLVSDTQLMNAFGFSVDEVIPKLTAWGNAVAASGNISKERIEGVVLAMGQMRTKGKVSAEEMNQLLERGIPAWELLAKAIGKSVAQTQKLAEQGKLKGRESVDAITAMMEVDSRYKGMMDRLSGTLTGRLSNLQDLRQQALGLATQGTATNLSDLLGAALDSQGGNVSALAAKFDTLLKPVGSMITAAAKTVLGGGIVEGLFAGLEAGKSQMGGRLTELLGDGEGLIGLAKSILRINSPSKEFHEIGVGVTEGLRDGFVEGMRALVMPAVQDGIADMLQQARGAAMSPGQRRALGNLERLQQSEPDFIAKLIAGSQARGINPDHMLNVMATETAGSFNPNARNPHSSATGLIQKMSDNGFKDGRARYYGMTRDQFGGMPATKQLDFVFKYLDQHLANLIGRGPISQAQLYASVGAGHASADDNTIMFKRGQRGYAGNAATWDVNRDGQIQQAEFGPAAQSHLGAGQFFSVLEAQVTQATNRTRVWTQALDESYNTIRRRATTSDAQSTTDAAAQMGGEWDAVNGVLRDTGQIVVNINDRLDPLLTTTSFVADETQLYKHEVKDVDKELAKWATEYDRAQAAAGSYFNSVYAGSGTLRERLKEVREGIPSLHAQLTDFVAEMPASLGNVFGQATQQWDGDFKHFFQSIEQGFAGMLKQLAAQLIESEVKSLLAGLLDGASGASNDAQQEKKGVQQEKKGGGGIFGFLSKLFGGGRSHDRNNANTASGDPVSKTVTDVGSKQIDATLTGTSGTTGKVGEVGQMHTGLLGQISGHTSGIIEAVNNLGSGIHEPGWATILKAGVQLVGAALSAKASGNSGDAGGSGGSNAGRAATGGFISGSGSPTSDSIATWLSNGEYVIRASAVTKFGRSFFDRLNAGVGPRFAVGGMVGGSHFVVQESVAGSTIRAGAQPSAGLPVTIHMTINTPDANSFRRSRAAIAAELASEMRRQHARLR